jgi:hypothetical protein
VYLNQLFRSFRPLLNPIGFGIGDFVLLGITILLAGLVLLRAVLWPHLAKIAGHPRLAIASLAGLVLLLRLALLGTSPAPTPSGADDFSYIVLGDTLRHFRMANATHPFHQFFEAVFVLQQPTYSSIYPLGQGLVLALGRILFGSFWAGVLLSVAAFCALCFWMLRGWTSPRWAFVGALLAIIQFGPLNQWTNSYWGGAVSACAGCLVFGALPRIDQAIRQQNRWIRNAVLLGIGLALQLLTRPFECILLLICVLLYWVLTSRTHLRSGTLAKVSLVAALAFLPAGGLTLIHNRAVTGSWTTLPYMLSRYQYGVPTTFTWQRDPIPHRALTPEQDLDYRAQAAIHGSGTDSLKGYLARLGYRLRYLRFFALAPLYLGLLFFLPSLRQAKWIWATATITLFLAGTNFYPYFFPHYIAAVAAVFLLVLVKGLENLYQLRPWAASMLCVLCGAHFLFWYGIHLSGSENLLPAAAYETWDYINFGDPEGRIAVNKTLAGSPGNQLVFVRYSPRHRFQEWIGNAANIDRAKVVWAWDLGAEENEKLIRYFPARKCWLLEPDARPPKLGVYASNTNPFESVQ